MTPRSGSPLFAWLLVALLGCSKAGTPNDPPAPSTRAQPTLAAPAPPTIVAPATTTAVTVTMTAATLAEDCGGAPPTTPPAAKAKRAAVRTEVAPGTGSGAGRSGGGSRSSRADRACQPSSMQLAISVPTGASPGDVRVKRVELFDESGASLGTLTASFPTRWADSGSYQPWDERLAAAQELAVSYALSQPDWSGVADRWSQTYVLKATVTVGGADQIVTQTVDVSAVTTMPANMKT